MFVPNKQIPKLGILGTGSYLKRFYKYKCNWSVHLTTIQAT